MVEVVLCVSFKETDTKTSGFNQGGCWTGISQNALPPRAPLIERCLSRMVFLSWRRFDAFFSYPQFPVPKTINQVIIDNPACLKECVADRRPNKGKPLAL